MQIVIRYDIEEGTQGDFTAAQIAGFIDSILNGEPTTNQNAWSSIDEIIGETVAEQSGIVLEGFIVDVE